VDDKDRKLARFAPIAHRMATGRLPGFARRHYDTTDIVQFALMRAYEHLDKFDNQPDDRLAAYLACIINHQLIDCIRSAKRRPQYVNIPDDLLDPSPTPEDDLIARLALSGDRQGECHLSRRSSGGLRRQPDGGARRQPCGSQASARHPAGQR
jgi:DNA-directed RNA polymerase specialized sigma24 family protein